ncbi:hypothetical protein, partial [Endozoicomonas sp. OPT23]|uniref:hypothetical protein n=1 Tax=Endozoicomonas sp. OPT23 TaxID=2072845 RepID=UPI0018910A12
MASLWNESNKLQVISSDSGVLIQNPGSLKPSPAHQLKDISVDATLIFEKTGIHVELLAGNSYLVLTSNQAGQKVAIKDTVFFRALNNEADIAPHHRLDEQIHQHEGGFSSPAIIELGSTSSIASFYSAPQLWAMPLLDPPNYFALNSVSVGIRASGLLVSGRLFATSPEGAFTANTPSIGQYQPLSSPVMESSAAWIRSDALAFNSYTPYGLNQSQPEVIAPVSSLSSSLPATSYDSSLVSNQIVDSVQTGTNLVDEDVVHIAHDEVTPTVSDAKPKLATQPEAEKEAQQLDDTGKEQTAASDLGKESKGTDGETPPEQSKVNTETPPKKQDIPPTEEAEDSDNQQQHLGDTDG